MRITAPLNSFNTVAPGQTATNKVAGQRRIFATILQTNATDATDLDRMVKEVRLKVGSVNLWKITIPRLLALMAYYGLPVGTGEIPLYFARSTARTPIGEEASGFNAFGVDDIVIEVEFRSNGEYNALRGGGYIAGFTPTLEGIIDYDYFNDTNRAFITVLDRSIQNSGAGEVDHDTLPRDGAYKAIHMFSNVVQRVQVFRDEVKLADRTLSQVNALNRRYGLVAQANVFHLDFGYTNQATDILEMNKGFDGAGKPIPVETFNLKITTNAGGTIPAIIEKVIRL